MAASDDRLSDPELTPWQILANLGDSLAVVDRDYRIVWVREPLAGEAQERLVGRRCYTVFGDGENHCGPTCPVAPILEGGQAVRTERRFIDPQGRERWREARAFPIVDNRGRLIYVARISFDITRRKKGEARRRRDREALEQSIQLLDRLQLSQSPFQPSPDAALSPRELEVIRLLAQAANNPQLARLLGISVNTVKRHVGNIFNKLGVDDRTQAAVWAARNGLA